MLSRRAFVAGALGFLVAKPLHAQACADHVYLYSVTSELTLADLSALAQGVQRNFSAVDIAVHPQVVDSFPQLNPLDVLILLLEQRQAPNMWPQFGLVDAGLVHGFAPHAQGINPYQSMRALTQFPYDTVVAQNNVGAMVLPTVTPSDFSTYMLRGLTHEVAHAYGARHVFEQSNFMSSNPLFAEPQPYFFSPRTIADMHEFLRVAHSLAPEALIDLRETFINPTTEKHIEGYSYSGTRIVDD